MVEYKLCSTSKVGYDYEVCEVQSKQVAVYFVYVDAKRNLCITSHVL